MRFLHTSDWHVGKAIRGRSRADEHAAVLAEIAGVADERDVDLVLVVGDLFDAAAPPPEAERIVYDALLRLAERHERRVHDPEAHRGVGARRRIAHQVLDPVRPVDPRLQRREVRIGPRPERFSRACVGVSSRMTLRPRRAALAAGALTRSIAPVGR